MVVEIKAWKEEQESDEFKQRQAEALANWDGVSPAVEMPPKQEIDMITTKTFVENDTQVKCQKN